MDSNTTTPTSPTPQAEPAARSRPTASTGGWRFPWAILFGVVLLVGTAVGASYALNGTSTGTDPNAQNNASKTPIRSVCFGFVDTEAGIVNLYPAQPGRVTEVLVEEGQLVEAGTVLFKMDDRLASKTVEAAREDLAAARLRVERAQDEVTKHKKTLESLDLALRAKEAELDGARPMRDKAQRLVGKGLASREDLLQAEAKIKALDLELQSKRDELDGARAIDTDRLIALARKDVASKEVQLEKAELALAECAVKAPMKGRVMRFFIRKGEPLGANPRTPAAQFVAETPRIVRAEITQDYAATIFSGQSATIQDDSIKGTTWNARVVHIGDWYTHRRSITLEPMQFNDVRTLEAILEFTDAEPPPVRIGQRVRVILHDRPEAETIVR